MYFIKLNCATLVPVLPMRRIIAIPTIRIEGERCPEPITYRFTQLKDVMGARQKLCHCIFACR